MVFNGPWGWAAASGQNLSLGDPLRTPYPPWEPICHKKGSREWWLMCALDICIMSSIPTRKAAESWVLQMENPKQSEVQEHATLWVHGQSCLWGFFLPVHALFALFLTSLFSCWCPSDELPLSSPKEGEWDDIYAASSISQYSGGRHENAWLETHLSGTKWNLKICQLQLKALKIKNFCDLR